MAAHDDLTHRVSSSYQQLSAAASQLNAVSDELGKFVGALDGALRKLNLGIATWLRLDGREDGLGNYIKRDLGYAKVGGKWGISLRVVAGNHNTPDVSTVEEWLFNEAPRSLRIEAVEKLPDLFDNLVREADAATRTIKSKTQRVQELAAGMNDIAVPGAGKAESGKPE
jgi:hypothetical protein